MAYLCGESIYFMSKSLICLIIGVISISIFPVLVKWAPVSGITSAFYRMFFGFLLILPYVFITRKFTLPQRELWLPIILCGLIFATDIAVWNLSIHYSNATQATLLTNLSPVWVGVGAFFFLPDKPKMRFWLGTLIALAGMVILIGFEAFTEMRMDKGFGLAILSGMLYASYMLVSKTVLNKVDIISFMTLNMGVSSIYLFLICLFFEQPVWGFTPAIWTVFLVQGLICQLIGWLAINYAVKKMDAKRVSLALLSQAIVTGVFAWAFIGEQITLQMIIGGIIILAGIAITYQTKIRQADTTNT
jgi:drug/metabolite transporter (DMT)-like permease